jgi:hypothetical protein
MLVFSVIVEFIGHAIIANEFIRPFRAFFDVVGDLGQRPPEVPEDPVGPTTEFAESEIITAPLGIHTLDSFV